MKPGDESLGSSPTLVGGQGKTDSATLAEGALLGNYRIIRLLGAGGMGAVYLVEHIHLCTRHALKTIRAEFARKSGFEKRFLREAKLAARLKHPHIVACTDTGVADGIPFLVMDYIEGPHREPLNLRQLLDQRRERGELLDEDEAAAVGLEICKALDYAHSYRDAEISNGIIHRDLKPANILLDKDTKLYIADFGLARAMGEKFEESVVQAHALSRSLGEQPTLKGQVSISADTVGTFDYMSPEQREGRVADARSDVYAMGVILYELLTGRKVIGVIKPPSKVRPALDPMWDEIICSRCLSYDPDERYATASDMCRAIEGVRSKTAVPPTPPATRPVAHAAPQPHIGTAWKSETPKPAVAFQRAKVVGAIAAVILGLLAVGGLVKLLSGPAAEPKPLVPAVDVQARERQSKLESALAAARTARVPAGFKMVGTACDTTSGLPSLLEHEQTGYRLCLVPAGEFNLGSANGEGFDNEHPARRIWLDAYWMGETEVTCEQFAKFLNEKGNQEEGGVSWVNLGPAIKITGNGSAFSAKAGFAQHPVVELSWYGARAFCLWMGGELPTEAQWEKAAKGGRDVKWPWGNQWDKQEANTAERLAGVAELTTAQECTSWWEPYQKETLVRRNDYSDTTKPVKSYRPNGYGLYDMAGNVWEWCQDWYVATAYQQLRDGARNPTGPSSGDTQKVEYWQGGEKKSEQQTCRVVRGGGWYDQASGTRCADRGRVRPAGRGAEVGVRVVVLPRP